MADDHAEHGFSTRAIHAGQGADPATGATVVPIYATSTFTQAEPRAGTRATNISRSGNPTRAALETCLAALEGGERALAFASGLAATTAVLSTLRPGDEVAAAADLYGGTFRLLERGLQALGPGRALHRGRQPGRLRVDPDAGHPKLVWIETPTNPLLQMLDIAAIAELAHRRGALLAVDNTFASPYLQRPIEHGADLVVHSTTKYLGGHSDVIGGAVIGRREVLEPIAFYQNAAGGRARAVRRLAPAPGHQDAGGPDGPALRATPASWPRGSRAAGRGAGSSIPACPTTPATRWRGGRCATSAG